MSPSGQWCIAPSLPQGVAGLYKTTVTRLQSCLCLSLLRLVRHKELQVFVSV